jgi:hypothetical protein
VSGFGLFRIALFAVYGKARFGLFESANESGIEEEEEEASDEYKLFPATGLLPPTAFRAPPPSRRFSDEQARACKRHFPARSHKL